MQNAWIGPPDLSMLRLRNTFKKSNGRSELLVPLFYISALLLLRFEEFSFSYESTKEECCLGKLDISFLCC